MLHGPQRGLFDLDFRIPAECADQVASGAADIGIVPSFELTRQDLEVIRGAGIACHGPVRSILLVSTRPAGGDPHPGGGLQFAHVGGIWRG